MDGKGTTGCACGVQVLSIDGKDTTGWNGATASENLRGTGGTKVSGLQLHVHAGIYQA